MTRMSPILTACTAIAAATSFAACSAAPGSDANSEQSNNTAMASDAAQATDDTTSTDSAVPPFPELGSFDPNMTGADMPDPCLWATPEFMAELGHDKFLGSKIFNGFRTCSYAPDVEHNPAGYSVVAQFNRTPLGSLSPTVRNEQEYKGITIYSYQDELMNFNAFAHINTKDGAFEIGVSEVGRPQADIEAEAVDIVKAFIKEYINAS